MLKAFFNKKIVFKIVLVFALFSLLGTSTFAWLQLRNSGDISFIAGGSSELTLYFATFQRDTTQPDPGLGNPEPGVYQWDSGIGLQDGGTFGEQYKQATSKLHMGNIENLLYRVESNVSWFCIKIKADGNRSFKGLRLSLDNTKSNAEIQNPFDLYHYAETVTPQKIEDAALISNITNTHIENLIVMDSMIITEVAPENFFTSSINSPYTPQEAAETAPGQYHIPLPNDEGTDPKAIMCKNPIKKKPDGTNMDVSTLSYSGEYTGNAESYYVYIRVVPILDAYGEMAVDISLLMPCVLTYNMIVEIETNSQNLTPAPTPPTPPAP